VRWRERRGRRNRNERHARSRDWLSCELYRFRLRHLWRRAGRQRGDQGYGSNCCNGLRRRWRSGLHQRRGGGRKHGRFRWSGRGSGGLCNNGGWNHGLRSGRHCRRGRYGGGAGRGSGSCTGQTKPPERGRRFSELQLHITVRGTAGFRFHDLADYFFFCFFVGQENQLAGRKRRSDANDGAVGKHENGLGGFGKRFALVGAFEGASAVDGDGNLEGNRLRASGRFRGRFGSRGGGSCCSGCSGSWNISFFQDRRHKVTHSERN